jgi:AcrR family transcriptional regulator
MALAGKALAGKTKHEVVSEFRCAEILAAARGVFARRGFNDATVEEIAAAAGIAKGTVYLYFPSKKEVYLAALKEGLVELRERTRQNMREAPGIRAKLRSFVATRLEFAEANRDFIHIYHAEISNLPNSVAGFDNEFRQLYLQQAKVLEAELQAAIKSGEIPAIRTDFAAFLIYDMVRGVMTQRLLKWSKATMAADIELLENMIWKGLGPA